VENEIQQHRNEINNIYGIKICEKEKLKWKILIKINQFKRNEQR